MGKLEMYLWAADFFITALGWAFGGPTGAFLCFVVAGLLVFLAVSKVEKELDSAPKLWHRYGAATLLLALIVGIGWLTVRHFMKSPEQTVAVQPPVQMAAPSNPQPTAPKVNAATSKPKTKPKTKTVTPPASASSSGNNSPAIGSISQGSGSALSINQQGGTTIGTMNLNQPSPPPNVTWSEQALAAKIGLDQMEGATSYGSYPDEATRKAVFENPGTLLTIRMDASWPAKFKAECDIPCYPENERVEGASSWNVDHQLYADGGVGLRVLNPNPLPVEYYLKWEIRSKTQDQVHVKRLTLIVPK